MKRMHMQTVVNCINVQSDYLWEYINDETIHPEDRSTALEDLNALCDFLIDVRGRGFNVDNCIYPLDKKVAKLGGNA